MSERGTLLRCDDGLGCAQQTRHDVGVLRNRRCIDQITTGIFHGARQHKDFVLETIYLGPGQQDVILIDAVGQCALAGLEVTLATASLAEPSGPAGSVRFGHRKPAPGTLSRLPLVHG